MKADRALYQLGHAKFSFTHSDPNFEPVIKRLLPLCIDQRLAPEQVIDIQMGFSLNLSECFTQIINQHRGSLLLQAACLISPNKKKVLISGVPNSGKTALALAFAFKYGWKVIAEDVVIIDAKKSELTCFAAPFHLKAGTRNLLSSVGIDLPGFVLGEWYPLWPEMAGHDCEAVIDLAVHLDRGAEETPFECNRQTVSEYTRKVLPLSNLLPVNGTQRFMDCLHEKSCYLLTGGRFSERLQKVSELCTNSGS